jgi:hypothetical protein
MAPVRSRHPETHQICAVLGAFIPAAIALPSALETNPYYRDTVLRHKADRFESLLDVYKANNHGAMVSVGTYGVAMLDGKSGCPTLDAPIYFFALPLAKFAITQYNVCNTTIQMEVAYGTYDRFRSGKIMGTN